MRAELMRRVLPAPVRAWMGGNPYRYFAVQLVASTAFFFVAMCLVLPLAMWASEALAGTPAPLLSYYKAVFRTASTSALFYGVAVALWTTFSARGAATRDRAEP